MTWDVRRLWKAGHSSSFDALVRVWFSPYMVYDPDHPLSILPGVESIIFSTPHARQTASGCPAMPAFPFPFQGVPPRPRAHGHVLTSWCCPLPRCLSCRVLHVLLLWAPCSLLTSAYMTLLCASACVCHSCSNCLRGRALVLGTTRFPLSLLHKYDVLQ